MDSSSISLIIQWVGVLVILGLLLFLTQSIRRAALDYWAGAWCCLALGLFFLYIEFNNPTPGHLLRTGYFLAEYAFAFLLLAGCRNVASGRKLARHDLLWLPGGIAAALLLRLPSDDFNVQFALHAVILAAFFFAAFLSLRAARAQQHGAGLTVMSVALLLLALDFLQYVPVFFVAARRGEARRFAYLNYTSSVDLILETILGFGMVMLTMESLRRDAERANRELQQALHHLEVLARTDPLTSALNRHAYHNLVQGQDVPAPAAGCVAVVDLNRLKLINDSEGHASGDRAIRQVATAIRSLIRADDLLAITEADSRMYARKRPAPSGARPAPGTG